jgi:glutamate/tyrosine decarboxylase-like PLP-dependent enzyme
VSDDKVELIRAATEWAIRYIDGERDSRAVPALDVEMPNELDDDYLAHPIPADAVIRLLAEAGQLGATRSTGGRYFGFVTGGVEPVGLAASTLAGAWDQNGALPVMSPIASRLDEIAARWVIELLELPARSVAGFCSGATVANLTGVIAGRDELLRRQGYDVRTRGLAGSPPITVIVGDEIHASATKALWLAGFGDDQMIRVATDECGRIRADLWPDTHGPALVMLQAGNVNTGHTDPLAAIIERLDRRQTWVHIDGAFGLWARLAPGRRQQVAGAELADSWATDGHKWLNAPYDCGVAICRDGDALARAMSASAAYVDFGKGERQPMNLGIQMSQAARAIPVWAILATLGREGLSETIERHCRQAARMSERLAAEGVEILAPVVLNQVLASFGDDATTDAVIAEVQRDGTCWMGGTEWHGRRAMRISVSDRTTTDADIDVCADAVLTAWGRLRTGSRLDDGEA